MQLALVSQTHKEIDNDKDFYQDRIKEFHALDPKKIYQTYLLLVFKQYSSWEWIAKQYIVVMLAINNWGT